VVVALYDILYERLGAFKKQYFMVAGGSTRGFADYSARSQQGHGFQQAHLQCGHAATVSLIPAGLSLLVVGALQVSVHNRSHQNLHPNLML
jgi:hypothetical protein